LLTNTQKDNNRLKDENVNLKTLIKNLEYDIWDKNKSIEKLLNIDKFPFDEINDDIMFGFKKELVDKLLTNDKDNIIKKQKHEHIKDSLKSPNSNKSINIKDNNNKMDDKYNKMISNLTTHHVREVIKTVAISKYKQYIRELNKKIENITDL